jgi:hypothetical protein
MIYNPHAIDYSKGVDFMPDGTIKGKIIGAWVYEIEELKKMRGWYVKYLDNLELEQAEEDMRE